VIDQAEELAAVALVIDQAGGGRGVKLLPIVERAHRGEDQAGRGGHVVKLLPIVERAHRGDRPGRPRRAGGAAGGPDRNRRRRRPCRSAGLKRRPWSAVV
jgi:hypothetical protein